MSNDTEPHGEWVPALRIESTTTPRQRARNFAFYERIRDGVPGDFRQSGLKSFVFEVPSDRCEVGPASPSNGHRTHFSFRLDPESDCYRRLVSYIVGHTASDCDADHSVDQLRRMLRHACDLNDALNGNSAPGGTTLELAERYGAVRAAFDEMRAQLDAFEARHGLGPVQS